MVGHWRRSAQAVIAPILTAHLKAGGKGDAELKKKLNAAYPFGQRLYYPYKVWLSEVRKAVRLANNQHPDGSGRPLPVHPGQERLFE